MTPDEPDPYAAYAALAAKPGLFRRGTWWVAAHPDAIRQILESDDLAVRPPGEPVPASLANTTAGAVFARLVRMRDDPARGPIKDALARLLVSFEPRVARTAHEAAARLAPERVLFDLAPHVLADLLGVPEAEHPVVARSAACFARALAPNAAITEPEALEQSVRDLERHASRLPGADIPNIVGLFFQSFDATAGLIGNAIVAIGRDPTFRADASERRIRGVVETAAARDPSIHNTRRFVTRDVSIAGQHLLRGDGVLVLLAADAASFGFGHGRHACPARNIAITIASAGVSAMLAGGPWPTSPRYHASSNARIPVL